MAPVTASQETASLVSSPSTRSTASPVSSALVLTGVAVVTEAPFTLVPSESVLRTVTRT